MNLNQITVPVTDMNRSIGFYERLGLGLIVQSKPTYARFHCPDGDATLSLHLVNEVAQGHGVWLYFEVADVDARVQALQDAGLLFDELATNQPWLWREARLRDPDGHIIIIYHAGSNRVYPPWRLPE
jgi:catechol 2,3-dioxygenase-like lactoylglutathione lyase family enzyme